MRILNLALAAALAVGAAGAVLADDAADDSVRNFGVIVAYPYESGTITAYAPTSGPYGPFTTVPASPWVQQQFNANQNLGVIDRDAWMLRQTEWVPPGPGGE